MLANMMLNFRKELKKHNISFCYSGYMADDILVGIGNTIKKHLAFSAQGKRKYKGVFSIFVELMQNLTKYSAERMSQDGDVELRYGVIAVGEAGYNLFVACGIIVHAADAVKFKNDLDIIKKLGREELSKLWKESLKKEHPEGTLDAQASFIDICRRAKGGIEYEFLKITANWYFFNFKAFL